MRNLTPEEVHAEAQGKDAEYVLEHCVKVVNAIEGQRVIDTTMETE